MSDLKRKFVQSCENDENSKKQDLIKSPPELVINQSEMVLNSSRNRRKDVLPTNILLRKVETEFGVASGQIPFVRLLYDLVTEKTLFSDSNEIKSRIERLYGNGNNKEHNTWKWAADPASDRKKDATDLKGKIECGTENCRVSVATFFNRDENNDIKYYFSPGAHSIFALHSDDCCNRLEVMENILSLQNKDNKHLVDNQCFTCRKQALAISNESDGVLQEKQVLNNSSVCGDEREENHRNGFQDAIEVVNEAEDDSVKGEQTSRQRSMSMGGDCDHGFMNLLNTSTVRLSNEDKEDNSPATKITHKSVTNTWNSESNGYDRMDTTGSILDILSAAASQLAPPVKGSAAHKSSSGNLSNSSNRTVKQEKLFQPREGEDEEPLVRKVLYIEPGVDEKASSRMLERSSKALSYPVSFIVVSNAFIGLECTEHAEFDLIIVKESITDLKALDMMHILRSIGDKTPIALLQDRAVDKDSTDTIDNNCNTSKQHSDPTSAHPYFALFDKPYSSHDLCDLIDSVVSDNKSRVHEWYNCACVRCIPPEVEEPQPKPLKTTSKLDAAATNDTKNSSKTNSADNVAIKPIDRNTLTHATTSTHNTRLTSTHALTATEQLLLSLSSVKRNDDTQPIFTEHSDLVAPVVDESKQHENNSKGYSFRKRVRSENSVSTL